jgi:hypothetical protein
MSEPHHRARSTKWSHGFEAAIPTDSLNCAWNATVVSARAACANTGASAKVRTKPTSAVTLRISDPLLTVPRCHEG